MLCINFNQSESTEMSNFNKFRQIKTIINTISLFKYRVIESSVSNGHVMSKEFHFDPFSYSMEHPNPSESQLHTYIHIHKFYKCNERRTNNKIPANDKKSCWRERREKKNESYNRFKCVLRRSIAGSCVYMHSQLNTLWCVP